MANKAELVDRVAKKTQLTKKDVSAVVDALFETIQEALQAGEKVQVIEASKVPAFKAGKALKDAVKN